MGSDLLDWVLQERRDRSKQELAAQHRTATSIRCAAPVKPIPVYTEALLRLLALFRFLRSDDIVARIAFHLHRFHDRERSNSRSRYHSVDRSNETWQTFRATLASKAFHRAFSRHLFSRARVKTGTGLRELSKAVIAGIQQLQVLICEKVMSTKGPAQVPFCSPHPSLLLLRLWRTF